MVRPGTARRLPRPDRAAARHSPRARGRLRSSKGAPTCSCRLPRPALPELATRYPSQLHSGPLGATIGLVLNTRVWPFSVLAARQALNYAIDRNKLIQLIGGPLAAQPTCQILPPALPGYQPYCPYTLNPGPGGVWTAPDLARAEQLVRASGTRGARVTVVTGAFGTQIPDQATGRYLVSVLDQLGYRASLQVITELGTHTTSGSTTPASARKSAGSPGTRTTPRRQTSSARC